MDLFVVPTLSFRLPYGFLVLRHHRRRIMWLGVPANSTAEWIARQLTEACGWQAAPDYIVRDCDCAYGEAFIRRLRAMDIRDRPTAPRSRWQNAYAERLIGSIRREGTRSYRCAWRASSSARAATYMTYYNEARTHLTLDKDASIPREIQSVGPDLRKASSRRTASPMRSDLICDKDQAWGARPGAMPARSCRRRSTRSDWSARS